jgi:hypothetical protein
MDAIAIHLWHRYKISKERTHVSLQPKSTERVAAVGYRSATTPPVMVMNRQS